MPHVQTTETRAAAEAADRNSNMTEELARQGVAVPDQFLDELTCVIMSGAYASWRGMEGSGSRVVQG